MSNFFVVPEYRFHFKDVLEPIRVLCRTTFHDHFSLQDVGDAWWVEPRKYDPERAIEFWESTFEGRESRSFPAVEIRVTHLDLVTMWVRDTIARTLANYLPGTIFRENTKTGGFVVVPKGPSESFPEWLQSHFSSEECIEKALGDQFSSILDEHPEFHIYLQG